MHAAYLCPHEPYFMSTNNIVMFTCTLDKLHAVMFTFSIFHEGLCRKMSPREADFYIYLGSSLYVMFFPNDLFLFLFN